MIGTSLGPYRIDRELGAGGMGRVYAATLVRAEGELAAGAAVALKVVHPHLAESAGALDRFVREVAIGTSIRHRNVVRTHWGGEIDGRRVLVMELVQGQTLRSLLRELERVPEELCRHIGREIACGLAAIHAEGVVHRDLKPENVLITAEHAVQVMDLGVARLVEESVRLSQSGVFVGSVEYAAPEQFGGGIADLRADLHALGLLLYELSSGRHPFRADDFRTVIRRICEEVPRRLGEVNPQLSPFFEEVVHTLLAKSPAERFPDARTVLDVLAAGERSEWWRTRSAEIRAETHRPLRRIRIPRETAVYGRETELAKLRELFGRAKAGDGQVVLVEGEAGIGKSRLMDEWVGRLQTEGEDLNFLFGGHPPGGAATAAGAFARAFREQFGDAGCAAALHASPLLVPAFDALLRGDPAPEGAAALTRDSLQTCFVHAARALAADRPTVIVIDDLHNAPEEARALFVALALAVPGHRLVLVGTTRPGIPEEWLAGLTRFEKTTRLPLSRLGPKDLAELLADSFRSRQLAHALGVQIGLKSDGNPFFAFEIIRGLREGQFITRRDDGTWVSTRAIDEVQVPSSVLDLVRARVADLAEAERDLLDVAACWGFEFDPTLVGDALGAARIPTLKRFAQIEKRHRLVRCVGERFVFDHHQVQEALYRALPAQLSREYHAALAEALETRAGASQPDGEASVGLCEQFLRAARGDRAVRHLARARGHLLERHLADQAASLLERVLACPDVVAGATRVRMLLDHADACDSLARRTPQEASAREAARLADEAGDPSLVGAAQRAVGIVLWRTGRYAEAAAAHRTCLESAREREDREAEAAATVNLGVVQWSEGSLSDAAASYRRGLDLAREIGHRVYEASAAVNLGVVLREQGRFDEAASVLERAAELARRLGDRRREATATSGLGLLRQAQGRLDEARSLHERELDLVREVGDRPGEARATGCLAGALLAMGRLGEALERYERSLALCRETGDRRGEATVTGGLSSLFLVLGRPQDALAHAERHLSTCLELRMAHDEATAHQEIGAASAATGDAERARRCFARSAEILTTIGDPGGVARAQLALGELEREAGDVDAARSSLGRARDGAREIGLPGIETLARCTLAVLPGGDPGDAVAALREHGDRLAAEESRAAHFLVWRSTGRREQLAEAGRLLQAQLSQRPPADREAMVSNVGVNREIVEACRAEGIA